MVSNDSGVKKSSNQEAVAAEKITQIHTSEEVCVNTEEAPQENLRVGSEAEEVVSVGMEWWDLQLSISVILVGSGARNCP